MFAIVTQIDCPRLKAIGAPSQKVQLLRNNQKEPMIFPTKEAADTFANKMNQLTNDKPIKGGLDFSYKSCAINQTLIETIQADSEEWRFPS